MKHLGSEACVLCKKNIAIPIGLISGFLVSLMFVFGSTFLVLWISGRVEAGILKDQAEAKWIY